MKWLKRSHHPPNTRIGIYLGQQIYALIATADRTDTPYRQTFSAHDLDVAAAELASLCREKRWRGLFCDLVLGSEFVKLQQTDSPKVPENERNQALMWSLRDMMEFPVNEALLQSFTLPPAVQRGGDRVYAAFCHKPKIQQLIQPILQAGLQIASIDIPELTLGNALRLQDPLPATSAILFDNNRGAVLYLYYNDDLVLSRQLAGVATLSSWSADELKNSDTFLLEVQRTLDFFERQIARRPVQQLFLPALNLFSNDIVQLLKNNLNVSVSALPMQDDDIAPAHRMATTLATAATLRREVDHATH